MRQRLTGSTPGLFTKLSTFFLDNLAGRVPLVDNPLKVTDTVSPIGQARLLRRFFEAPSPDTPEVGRAADMAPLNKLCPFFNQQQ
ncbi:hypothetical protein ACU4GI_16905 [Cupriavidus basilensis]|uniref:hypothetical protein n=1 Tax=Cupriavidus TaxID=106589 RepID=UPI00126925D1|nr:MULTISPECIES: hypothetical protein [Cupriavidus]MDF3885184.1 hypothetical protein [Cupriavidus basilensis]